MNKIVVIAILVVVSIAVFIAATLIFNPNKITKQDDISPIISSNYKLDCTGFWEDNPLCVERNNSIRALQELEFVIEEVENIIDGETDLKYQSAKIIKKEGDTFFRDEFYFKAEMKYKNALDILNEIKDANKSRIDGLWNKAIIAYNEDQLNEALVYFEELNSFTSDEEITHYITKINNREEILKLNKKAMAFLSTQNFDDAKVSIFNSIGLDKDYLPSIKIKDKILKEEKDFKFLNYINETYTHIDQLNFQKARNSINKAKELYPNSDEIIQVENRLKRTEKENIVEALLFNIDKSLSNEEWVNAMDYIRDLLKINPSMVNDTEANKVNNILNFLKLADIHLANPERLSSKNVFDEASRNYELGRSLVSEFTPKLNKKVSEVDKLIQEYSKRINITIKSNNETYLDIERFKSFDPFDEFTITVRPGNYVFIAKKPGVESYRKKINVKSTDINLIITVICDLSCSIN